MISRNVIALRPAEQAGVAPLESTAGIAASAASFADEQDYFESAAQRELLDNLFQALPHNEATLLVRGPAGSGKTTLVQRFLQLAPEAWEITSLQARIAVGESHLVKQLNAVLFPEQQLNAVTLTRLLLTRARGETFMLLVVDDAQRLSPFALRRLLLIKRAVADRGGRLGLLLVASADIDRLLVTPSIAEIGADIVHHFDLPPFSMEETGEYIHHRLAAAGISPPPELDDNRLRTLHRLARGRPQAINRLTARLMQGESERRPYLQGLTGFLGHYKVFLLSLTAFAILFVGGFLIYDTLSDSSPPRLAGDEAAVAVLIPPPLTTEPLSQEKASALLPPAPSPAPAAKIKGPPPAATNSKKIPATPPVPARPKAAVTPVSTKPVPKTAPPPAAPGAEVHDSKWVMAQDSTAFTIQLTSWEDKGRAIRYIKDNQLLNDAAYVHTRTKSKDWYLVIYRTYPSLGQARLAIDTLPPSLKQYGPWVRNISSLQSLAVLE